jgi:hypothetical protein
MVSQALANKDMKILLLTVLLLAPAICVAAREKTEIRATDIVHIEAVDAPSGIAAEITLREPLKQVVGEKRGLKILFRRHRGAYFSPNLWSISGNVIFVRFAGDDKESRTTVIRWWKQEMRIAHPAIKTK